nr:hypothetical protein [Massilia glaciei]
MTSDRRALLDALCGAGPVCVHDAARRVDRDLQTVGGDIDALLNAGVLGRTDDGAIIFPYDAVKIAF